MKVEAPLATTLVSDQHCESPFELSLKGAVSSIFSMTVKSQKTHFYLGSLKIMVQ